MNLWEWAEKRVTVIYWIMFAVGIVLMILSQRIQVFSLQPVFSSVPIVAGITASYLWIRLDVWRSDKTIGKLTSSKDAVDDLISRRADSRVALALLVLAAIFQAFLQEPKLNWLVFVGILLILVPVCNCIARRMEKTQFSKFDHEKK